MKAALAIGGASALALGGFIGFSTGDASKQEAPVKSLNDVNPLLLNTAGAALFATTLGGGASLAMGPSVAEAIKGTAEKHLMTTVAKGSVMTAAVGAGLLVGSIGGYVIGQNS